MRRIVSVWLPMWPIERLRRQARLSHGISGAGNAGVPDDTPLVLVETGRHGISIAAVNEAAARDGVRVGTALADARAALPALASRPAEPHCDRAALVKLARWAGRYGPSRNTDGTQGLWIDITGVAHLFGGEAALLSDLSCRLEHMQVTARLGLADTLGAAYALARHAPMDIGSGGLGRAMAGAPPCRPWRIAPAGETCVALAGLPVEGLRLDGETVTLLARLGLRRIGQLYDLPRQAIELRFRREAPAFRREAPAGRTGRKAQVGARLSKAVLLRLDQALGRIEEPCRALGEPPVLSVRRLFAEPLISSQGIEAEAGRLAGELCGHLEEQGLGCLRLRLSLYRADGTLAEVAAGLSAPSRAPRHLMALLGERLADVDAGFGVDCMALEAVSAGRIEERQRGLASDISDASGPTAHLVDRLVGRLGTSRVVRLRPRASHLPEHAVTRVPALAGIGYEPPWPYGPTPRRPAFLLSVPEPITVTAEVPEGPPRRFTWRRRLRRVVRAEGPERIAAEWWRHLGMPKVPPGPELPARIADGEEAPGLPAPPPPPGRPRDYYRIEDEVGGAYWVFRDGLYQRAHDEGAPRWYLHGLFA